jgi:hypothetical protein
MYYLVKGELVSFVFHCKIRNKLELSNSIPPPVLVCVPYLACRSKKVKWSFNPVPIGLTSANESEIAQSYILRIEFPRSRAIASRGSVPWRGSATRLLLCKSKENRYSNCSRKIHAGVYSIPTSYFGHKINQYICIQ